MTGSQLITRERKRQIDEEGYKADHDDEHTNGEIAQAAAALITCDWKIGRIPWPWDNGLKANGEVNNLIRAGALIAAEIDRLLRAEKRRRINRDLSPGDAR